MTGPSRFSTAEGLQASSPAEAELAQAHERWLDASRRLIASREALTVWQDRRYTFAYTVGRLLTEPLLASPTTHVLYGVYAAGIGLAYVGQTADPVRRLRDLPIGESHHVATTIAPELWERVIVLDWPKLLLNAPAAERAALEDGVADTNARGLPLEHSVQLALSPPLNLRKRSRDGTWSDRKLEASRSHRVHVAAQIPVLLESALAAWASLEAIAPMPDGAGPVATAFGHVVFPSVLRL